MNATITTEGTAHVVFPAESALITIRIDVTEDWSGSALQRVSVKAADIQTLLEKHSLPPKCIDASGIVMKADEGITATALMHITVPRIDDLSSVFTLLTSISGIEIVSTELSSAKTDEYLGKALRAAYSDAEEKARNLAEAASSRITALLSIAERETSISPLADELKLEAKAEIQTVFSIS